MNKSEECEIVQDLSTLYLENLISSKSKNFIENHLQNCKNCKKYYNDISTDIFNANKKEEQEDDIESSYLKKVGKHIQKLKICLVIILIIIIFFISIITIKYYKISDVINKSYNKLETIKTLNNYRLIQNTIYQDFEKNTKFEDTTNIYYIDGKYKIDTGNSITYYEDNSYNKICVHNDLKTIEYYNQDFIEKKKGKTFDMFSEITRFKELETGFRRIGLTINEERFKGKDCYVIRIGNSNRHKDTWIDKEQAITVRVVDEEYQNFYREVIYTLLENETTSNDVDSSILDSESYKEYNKINIDNNNVLEEIKEHYK